MWLTCNYIYTLLFSSTREIKPNEKDIGRKVKLKQSRTSLPPIRREPPPAPKPSYQSNLPPKSNVAAISSSNGLSNGLGSNHVSSSRPQLNKPSVPDIARRPIKYVFFFFLLLLFWSDFTRSMFFNPSPRIFFSFLPNNPLSLTHSNL